MRTHSTQSLTRRPAGRRCRAAGVWAFCCLAAVAVAPAAEVVLEPSQDNTLCEDAAGARSNGAGDFFFAGRTGQPPGSSIRRGLLAFDIAGSIPGPAVIESVELSIYMSRTQGGETGVTLHRVLAPWGEGASDAPGGEGVCETAEAGDATWLFAFWPTTQWAFVGGDFSAAASAAQFIDGEATYTWGPTEGMAADVQSWLDEPLGNFGWLLMGDESSSSTAKRFSSRESQTPSSRPHLTIEYTPVIFADGFESGDTSSWDATIP